METMTRWFQRAKHHVEQVLGRLSGSTGQYVDTTTRPNKWYWYRVRGLPGGSPSNIAAVKTPGGKK